ncbi:hypothetical protein [Sinorhizobium sp. RAC02]|uniref:hypothetical protein n=1 Tax=Sinorhizobium sp. RAC02 TaxID=1842534 RepID=UPI00336C1A4A
MQLYVSIVTLSFIHISSRYTLSVACGIDLSPQRIVVERRQHVVNLIETYVRSASNGEQTPPSGVCPLLC